MTVDGVLLVLVPLLASLGTIVLGLGQHQHSLSIVAVFAAITSAVFTDWLKWFRLNPAAANFAALAAVGYSFLRLSEGASETQLISVANLLIYLQIILLYQRKHLRLYWHICLLSLLQVVVAAALELGPQFGALLIVYMFLTLFALTLLFIRGESSLHQYLTKRLRANSDNSNSLIEFSGRETHLRVVENRMLNGQLVFRMLMLGLWTIVLTTFMFFLVPRFGEQRQGFQKASGKRLVGFSPQVNLGEMGETLESPEVVMRAQFTKADGTPFNVLVDPYFRGNVLTKYVPRQGIWLDAGERFRMRSKPLAVPPTEDMASGIDSEAGSTVAIQTIVLESAGPMFSVFPAFAAGDELLADHHRMLLLTEEDGGSQQKQRKFTIATTAFRNGIQRKLTPAAKSTTYRGRLAPLLQFHEFDLPKLKELANELVSKSEIEEGDHQAVARHLETFFRTNGGFSYTLNQDQAPPAGIDPIEHFVTESRRGHCEYYASALAMMLRSLEIPARVVVGFHGGEYNRMGHFFLVRQLHAHAWVEAYLSPQQLEEFNTFDDIDTKNGAWLRLDPTPSTTTHNVDVAKGGLMKRLSQIGDLLEVMWKDYVIGLNSARQREAIYRPIMESTSRSLWGVLLNPEWWMLFATELQASLGLDSFENFKARWVNWRSIPLLAAIFFALLVLRRLWRFVSPHFSRWIAKRFRGRKKSWARDPQLAWYRRLERFLAKRGHRRKNNQTHREFFQGICNQISATDTQRAMRLANDLVDGFYQARFGNRKFSAQELQKFERTVRDFEAALSP